MLMHLIFLILKTLLVVLGLIVGVVLLVYAERRVIAYMQSRIGPNRIGIMGLLQPVADVLKLLHKEPIRPVQANLYLYLLAPIIMLIPALAVWAAIPLDERWVLADMNAGILYILAISSLGVYGILIAGWASNSKYALYGALRSCAQMIAYEIGMGLAIVGVLMLSGTMNINGIIEAQRGNFFHWYWLPLFPLFMVYFISGIAETNRAPFDVAEGETELVAGFHVEYTGIGFALFFLAEYINMILIAALASILFLGGWFSPFYGIPYLEGMFRWIPGFLWLFLKMGWFLFLYLWIRATFPRYRYDQIMRLGWKVLIPITLAWIIILGIVIQVKK